MCCIKYLHVGAQWRIYAVCEMKIRNDRYILFRSRRSTSSCARINTIPTQISDVPSEDDVTASAHASSTSDPWSVTRKPHFAGAAFWSAWQLLCTTRQRQFISEKPVCTDDAKRRDILSTNYTQLLQTRQTPRHAVEEPHECKE